LIFSVQFIFFGDSISDQTNLLNRTTTDSEEFNKLNFETQWLIRL